MSYNSRRSGGYNTNNRGNMRGGLQQNFVHGGQYQTGPKPAVQPPMRQQQQQQSPQQTPPQQQQQQTQPQQQQNLQQQLHQPPPVLPPAPLKSAMKKEVKPEIAPAQNQQQPPVQPPIQPPAQPLQQQQQEPMIIKDDPIEKVEDLSNSVEQNGDSKKRFFIKGGRISKKEKRGRRNQRLRKMLMPKNALMVLNELVGGQKFNIIEKDRSSAPCYLDPGMYCASVMIEGNEHIGYGKSKGAAKTSAAENALRHIILAKIGSQRNLNFSSNNSIIDGDTESIMTMDTDDTASVSSMPNEEDISWLHVASFAMHKLFSTWYSEGDEKSEQVKQLALGNSDISPKLQDIKGISAPAKQRRPAKQLPACPQLLNPVMLLNQMRDDVIYEDFTKDGNPPNISFTIKCILDGKTFYGRGKNKKTARKNCAYAACSDIFGLAYPKEEYDPTGATEPMAIN